MISGPGWFGRVLADVAPRGYPDETRADVDAAVRAIETGLLDFARAIAVEAGVPAAIAEARCVAIAYSMAAVNLADDLADGDCDYLDEPHRSGPTTQYLLQSLFFQKLCELGLPPDLLHAVTRDFEQVAALQHVELATRRWTFDASRRVAEGITGRQIAAYLRVALHASDQADLAERVGLDVGLAAHVALDAESKDERFWSLDEGDREQLRQLALDSIDRATALEIEAIVPVAAQVRRTLDRPEVAG